MNAVSTPTATNLNELKRNSIAREYKYQLLSFMQEFETLETYKRQKDALKRRAEYCTELLDILDTRSAVEVIEDVKSENERINDRIKEQQLVLKYKSQVPDESCRTSERDWHRSNISRIGNR